MHLPAFTKFIHEVVARCFRNFQEQCTKFSFVLTKYTLDFIIGNDNFIDEVFDPVYPLLVRQLGFHEDTIALFSRSSNHKMDVFCAWQSEFFH